MSSEKIVAEKRTEFGKGAARRIRRENKIPAVVYGHGADPIHLSLPGHATMMALKNHGANALLELDIEGKIQLAMTKQVQVDDVRRVIEHVDFVAVRAGEKVTVDIPVHVVGDAISGTMVVTDANTLTVETEATHVPEGIEISVEGLEAGTQILAGAVELPKGTTLVTDPEALVVNITEAQINEEPADGEAAEGEAAEAAEAEATDGE
ncbi:50S ribosomal protein L25/general stress protein Ctc [Nocardioides albus]|uniref:Large ribosomal subunit protein bL25 n=1 Tax=Nocardioides albus TaxID=1841 RepID=A0A7W5A318_9ACTN|nr:50S ribosomal protein L25/general stress protein Ctc [Nocardioides albus]MBB3088777.1 large subunit ribosomal protein L25 [Nocardioides albus]GGU18560.1 50S ribosomal protein L25 [Nocardioides albus]